MKTTILIIAAAMISCLPFGVCYASVAKTGAAAPSDTTTHAMLHPDANTVYLDTAGKKVTAMEFMVQMKTGKYTFLPDMKDGKVISVKLKTGEKPVIVNSMAPGFSGTDVNGHAFDLATLKGKTVVLNFWFTSCAPCMQEMPELNGLVDKYKNDNSVVFLAVTFDSAEKVKAFLSRKEFKFNILAGRADIVKQYGVSGFPTSMIIDKTGNIAFSLTTYDGTNIQQLDGVIGALKK